MREYIYIIDKLEKSFFNSKYDVDRETFIIKKNAHTDIMRLKIVDGDSYNIVKCRILERLTPIMVNNTFYSQKWRNDKFKEGLKQGLSNFCDKEFTWEDIEVINNKLGSAINRNLAKQFVINNCDINILKK